MRRGIAVMALGLSLLVVPQAFAQTESAGPGRIEVTVVPGGGTFFTDTNGPSFGNYNLGGAFAYNFSRFVGVEGEAGGTLGISQDLQFGTLTNSVKTPNIVNYSGNVIVAAPSHSGVVPYAVGGVGGLTFTKTAALGINDTTSFLTGDVGGGVKWYANHRWGLRADYRFLAVRAKDDAPAFFGSDTRYGHRIYGAVVINALR
jgi:outer membrane protein with beta-barrel domain